MLTDVEIAALLDREAEDAEKYCDDVAGPERARNLDYYLRRPRGDERTGRSRVISSDVADTVNHLVPALVDVFVSGDKAVEAMPRGPEDVEAAEQATEVCNYVFLSQNPGFSIIYSWLKDGLLLKNGFVKCTMDADTVLKEERYEGLTPDEWQMLQADEGVEVVEAAQGMDGSIFATVRRKADSKKICISPVPPEEIVVCADARSPDIGEARYLRHRTWKTRSELVSLGYEDALIDSLPTDKSGQKDSPLWLARNRTLDEEREEDGYWYEEHYLRADVDEDGIAEYRLICKVGKEVLRNEVIEDNDFASWTPKPLPHEFVGECPADDAIEIQDVKTTIWRQTLDSLYQAVAPRWQAVDGQVNLDDLMDVRPGRYVRMKSADAAKPLLMPWVGAQTFPALEYVDGVREQRTGVSRVNGNDVASINKTATGASIASNRDQQQVRMMARQFAEVGLKRLFRIILRLLSQHQTEPMVIRLRNQFVPVDPRAWANQYDFTVNVGMGATDKDQQMRMLGGIVQSQMMALQAGMSNLVTPANFYHAQEKLTQLAGFKDATKFWTNPEQAQQQIPPQIQAQMMQMQQQLQQAQQLVQENASLKLELQNKQAEHQLKAGELQLKARDQQIEAQQEQERLGLEKVKTAQAMRQEGGDLKGTVESLAQQVQQMNKALAIATGPKKIIRDQSGRPVGIAPA